MRVFGVALVAVLMILGGSSVAQATMITIDPDSFAPGTLLTNAFPGITLRSIGLGFDGNSDPGIYAVDPTAYLEPYSAPTGRLVFGTDDGLFPHVFGGYGGATFRVDFAGGTSQVRLYGVGNDSSDVARLQAFSSADALLATYTTGVLGTSAFEMMVVSPGSDIAYVVASGVGGDSVGFDRLQYEAVPEPATLVLLGAGIGLLAARRRKAIR